MSTTARRYWLKLLAKAGVKSFVARTDAGYPFVCYVGDFAGEVPFFNRNLSKMERSIMIEWCRQIDNPIIFDVGANNGFLSSQIALELKTKHPSIYAFEPVPSTFAQLLHTIDKLQLGEEIVPICCALSDRNGFSTINFDPKNTLFSQMRHDINPRVGARQSIVVTMTLDSFVSAVGIVPSLLKIDVEGSEFRVLRGAKSIFQGPQPPAIIFEWNFVTIREVEGRAARADDLPPGYRFYYVDDFEGQRLPFGSEIPDIRAIDWVCNIFAVPSGCLHTFQIVRDRATTSITVADV